MSLMVSISGIRGIVGESLTPEIVIKYGSAFAEYSNHGTIIIGRDGRSTGHSIANLVSSTLLQKGCNVVDLGICPTPTVGLAVERMKAAGGIAITASHNPMIWNGMKFIAATGMFLNANENRKFWSLAEHGNFKYSAWDKQGDLQIKTEFINEHIQAILSLPYIDKKKIAARKFKVVVDCVNASGGIIVPKLLREFGCDVIELHCDVRGIFAHTPEPIPENLTELSSRVVQEKADLGIAIDPDSDRLVLITDRGIPFVEEYTVVSATKFVLHAEKKLGKNNHSVVVNLSTTRAVEDVAAEYGATVLRTPVGEINVASKMKELGSVIGGEGSGGVILPQVHLSRDAIVGVGLFLQLLTEFGGTASELKASLPQYEIVKNKIELGSMKPDAILAKLHEKYSKSERTNNDDGLKIDFASSWVHLRKSNTEPIIRIIAEAKTKDEAGKLVERFQKEILN
ncbi:MAG: phosphoglucosamine mutase [Ignavibacteriales bacterium]|nr:phosphoglucosamine mutase [Ignavibacteriales bacterium]